MGVDVGPLRRIVGEGRILTGEADILTYSYDSALDRSRPDAVVLAKTAEEIQETVRFCVRRRVPFLARGAGTNLSGGCIPLKGGVVISTALMDRIWEIDTRRRFAVVEPGVVNLHLQKELEKEGFFYGPDPASYRVCTLGGNVAENAGGPRCLKYGVTSNHVLAVEAVMPDASLQRFAIEDRGPEVLGLLAGAEGTLGIVTKAWLNILPNPESILTIVTSFPSMEDAMHCVSGIVAAGILPRTLEAMDRLTLRAVEDYIHAGYPADAEAVLLIELDGSSSEVAGQAGKVEELCRKNKSLLYRCAFEPEQRERLWEARRSAYAAMARVAPNVLVEDGVVPRNLLPEALKRIKAIASRHNIRVGLLFHAGDGNLHPNIVFDERDKEETQRVKKAGYEMLRACVELGGSISGEHGIGVDKRESMSWLFTPETLALFRRIKQAFDPENLCNPDKIIPLKPSPELCLTRVSLSPPAQRLAEQARQAYSRRKPLAVNRAPEGFQGTVLSTAGLDQVLDFDKSNYTLQVEAGVRLKKLREFLNSQGYDWALPDSDSSLGGAIASKARIGIRDQILGMRLLLSNGDVVVWGGKVVKNVAGYDLSKLILGSQGKLAVILDVTLRLYPLHSVPGLGTGDWGLGQSAPATAAGASRVPAISDPSPFINEWQKKIKKAFDPENLFV